MPEIRFCTLASGSSGNAIYLENADGAVLIDAGLSGKRIADNLKQTGRDIAKLSGAVITHGHHDHDKGAGVIARRHKTPIFMTEATHREALPRLGARIDTMHFFAPGASFGLGGFTIHTIPTPHDADGSVALVLEHDSLRIGVLTDLGHPFAELTEAIKTLDAVILESNYDPVMLANGPYPPGLQARIKGPAGHISNEESATLLRDYASERLQIILLAHLSENNNHPDVAMKCHRAVAQPMIEKHSPLVRIAPRHTPSEMFILRKRVGAGNG